MMNTGAAQYRAQQTGDAAAIVARHAELVRRIAHHLAARLPASVEIDDLIQAGMIGLIEAARNFQSDQGATFETYASIRIRGSMIDEIRRRRLGAALGAPPLPRRGRRHPQGGAARRAAPRPRRKSPARWA